MMVLGKLSLLVALAAIGFWYGFYRPQPLIDPSLAGPHDVSYYQQMAWWFEESSIDAKLASKDPDALAGRTAIITGGSSGIGKAVAKSLAEQGCNVIITSRSLDRATSAANDIGSANVQPASLDLSDFDDVEKFAHAFLSSNTRLNYLVLNAGMGPLIWSEQLNAGWTGPWLSPQGYEELYAANYLGHFKLMQLLLPSMKGAVPARVSATSSISHTYHDGNVRDGSLLPSAQRESHKFGSLPQWVRQYGNTKLAQVLMLFEAQRRATSASGYGHITFTPVAPGFVSTAIGNSRLQDRNGKDGTLPGGVSVEDGAMTTLHALLSASHEHTRGVFLQPFYSPLHGSDSLLGGWEVGPIFETIGQRVTWGLYRWKPHPDAFDENLAKVLWDASATACSVNTL